ncbi:MAG: LCP family protein [Actinomycetota bacterium]|nr:LCP family protein [Actinomycetota bacterium]
MPRGKHRRSWYRPSGEAEGRQTSARREAQKKIRRSKRRRVLRTTGVVGGAIILIALIGLGGYAVISSDGGDKTRPPQAVVEKEPPDSIDTTLLFGTDEQAGESGGAVWLTLLGIDRKSGRGSVIYIPAHTAAEVPGRGLFGVGESLSSGGIPLLLVTVENLLGVRVDRYVELSDSDSQVLFEETGDISVDVPTEVHVRAGPNKTRLLFPEGPQLVSAKFLKKLLFVLGVDSDEAELGSRHLAFWDGFFEHYSDSPGQLSSALEAASGALSESDAPIEDLIEFFERLVETPADERSLATLPVTQVSVGGDELYQSDEKELRTFLKDTLGSQPSIGDEVRVQILNGNGVPGIGEKVAERLSGENFRVILSGNARTLDYQRTLIVTYDPSEKGQAVAERARELIGVGEVQVSGQGQGIVDLTIVVGKDFLRID